MIGVQVFRKEDAFDPRTDPIVRVQARRLRAKLMRYYSEEGRFDLLTIELPKGGYAPVFQSREAAPPTKRSVGAALVSRNSIVVLPFLNHSGDAELDAFGKGVGDEVVHRLAQLPGLRVRKADGDGDAEASGQDGGRAHGGRDRPPRRQPRPRQRPPARRGDRSVSLVGVGGRRYGRCVRRAGARRRGGHTQGGTRRRRGAWRVPRRARRRQSRGAEPVPSGPLPPQPAHRGRADEGGRLLREGARGGFRVGDRAQRPRRRLRPARALRGPRTGRGLEQGRRSRGLSRDDRRRRRRKRTPRWRT